MLLECWVVKYAYIDESGDLGFDFGKSRTTSYFIVTAIVTSDPSRLRKLVRNVQRTLKRKHKQKSGSLHAFRERNVTRRRMLKSLAKENLKVVVLCVNKKHLPSKLRRDRHTLYNHMIKFLLYMVKEYASNHEKIFLVASRKSTSKFINKSFKAYLGLDADFLASVEVKTPFQEKCLQATDFVSWAIFRNHEHRDPSFYSIIKDLIIREERMDGKNDKTLQAM